MSHMVIYRGADGKPGFHQVDELAAAVAFVEKLRNDQSVESSRIYRLEQVNYRFEPYFQVRLEESERPPSATVGTVATPAAARTLPRPAAPAAESTAAATDRPPFGQHAKLASGAPPAVSAGADTAVSATAAAAETEAEKAATETVAGETVDAANGIRRGLFGR